MADIFDSTYKFLNKSVSYIFGRTDEGEDMPIQASEEGHLFVSIGEPLTALGRMNVSQDTVYIQATAVYNLLPANLRDFNALGGTATVEDRLFVVQTGTTQFGYGAIQSFRSLNFKVGQGGDTIFAAIFDSNTANSWSGVGLISISDELSFGYNGTAFGVWYRYGGASEVRTITVTVAAGGSTNLTLTLNDVIYTIPLTAGTTEHNAYQIETWLNANQTVWVADQIGSTVIIASQTDGEKNGTYSYSHATSTGTITRNTAGATKTSVHTPHTSFNKNTISWIDPSKFNVYRIVYDGDVKFYVSDRNTGEWIFCHIIKWANQSNRTLLDNPSLRCGLYVASVGSTTNIKLRSEYLFAAVQGLVYKTRNPRAVKNTQNVSTSFLNVLTIRNRRTYNSVYNQVEIQLLNLNISSEASQNVEIEMRANAVITGDTNFANAGTNLVTDVDISANPASGGTLLAAFTLASKGNQAINLEPLDIRVPPSLRITIAARIVSGAASNITATLTYYEDL